MTLTPGGGNILGVFSTWERISEGSSGPVTPVLIYLVVSFTCLEWKVYEVVIFD